MDVESSLRKINDLQARCFAESRRLRLDERGEWNDCVWKIKNMGYSLHSRKVRNERGTMVGVIWSASKPRTRHFTAMWKDIDMTPNDGKPTCKGNCTTRAMAYCLRGIFTYREIETEQYRLAKLKNEENGIFWGDRRRKTHRNSNGTWDSIMTDFGYCWVHLLTQCRRDNLAYALREVESPMITLSSGHVAVIEKGCVVDSWDSRHGRCTRILLKEEDFDKATGILSASGIVWRR